MPIINISGSFLPSLGRYATTVSRINAGAYHDLCFKMSGISTCLVSRASGVERTNWAYEPQAFHIGAGRADLGC